MFDGYGNSNNNCNKKNKSKKKKNKKSHGKRKTTAEQSSAAKSINEWVFPESSSPPLDEFQVPRSHRLAESLIFELHSHSICSDGFLSPSVLVERAHRNGVSRWFSSVLLLFFFTAIFFFSIFCCFCCFCWLPDVGCFCFDVVEVFPLFFFFLNKKSEMGSFQFWLGVVVIGSGFALGDGFFTVLILVVFFFGFGNFSLVQTWTKPVHSP